MLFAGGQHAGGVKHRRVDWFAEWRDEGEKVTGKKKNNNAASM